MSKAELGVEIAKAFPERVGEIKVEQFASFPLKRRHAQSYFKSNLVLVGDSAHTINPLAGQGVNLGFKDVAVLLETLETGDYSDESLAKYERERRTDNLVMQGAMDAFYLGFSNSILPLKLVRNVGLRMANNAGAIKQQALKYALGL